MGARTNDALSSPSSFLPLPPVDEIERIATQPDASALRAPRAGLTVDVASRIVDQVLLAPDSLNSLCRSFRPSGSSSRRTKASTWA